MRVVRTSVRSNERTVRVYNSHIANSPNSSAQALLLVLDADNTLWDTSSVFVNAQLALLDVLHRAGLCGTPTNELGFIRRVDALLAERLQTWEYDPRDLASVLVRHFTADELPQIEVSIELAITRQPGVPARAEALVEAGAAAFRRRLEEIPALFAGVADTLQGLRHRWTSNESLIIALFTEGERSRVERVIAAHGNVLDGVFDDIIIAPKHAQAFADVRQRLAARLPAVMRASHRAIMVGDALTRDIAPANEAGYTTVYRPAAFRGNEQPRTEFERPTYVIDEFAELSRIVDLAR
jgi:putative hydrolase of the HAD superfamily